MFKVGIIGADGRKWHPEQIPKLRSAIYDILYGLPIEVLDNRVGGNYEIVKLWTEGRQDELIVVSGHCPIGKERPYCVGCNDWIEEKFAPSHACGNPHHAVVWVYDEGGVDTQVEIIATELGLKKEIHPAEVLQWNDKIVPAQDGGMITYKGYRSRNINIAKTIPLSPNGVLIDIEPKGSCSHCGGKVYPKLIFLSHKSCSEIGCGLEFTGCGSEIGTGFASREDCRKEHEKLVCQWCKGTGNYSGATWTKRHAEKLGKETHLIVIE